MAKVGYIFLASQYEDLEADKEWMLQYGCVHIVEEEEKDETLRPKRKKLMAELERGDEIVLSKFSNAMQSPRELSAFIELCRIKVIRIISIHDKIDSHGKLFPETTIAQVLEMFGSLPEEVAALRKASDHALNLQLSIISQTNKKQFESKTARDKAVINMYNNGHSIESIMATSGFRSRSSIFRVLKKYNIKLTRKTMNGPLDQGDCE